MTRIYTGAAAGAGTSRRMTGSSGEGAADCQGGLKRERGAGAGSHVKTDVVDSRTQRTQDQVTLLRTSADTRAHTRSPAAVLRVWSCKGEQLIFSWCNAPFPPALLLCRTCVCASVCLCVFHVLFRLVDPPVRPTDSRRHRLGAGAKCAASRRCLVDDGLVSRRRRKTLWQPAADCFLATTPLLSFSLLLDE